MSGVAFTIIFFVVFTFSEHTTRKRRTAHGELDQFNLSPGDDLTPEALQDRLERDRYRRYDGQRGPRGHHRDGGHDGHRGHHRHGRPGRHKRRRRLQPRELDLHGRGRLRSSHDPELWLLYPSAESLRPS